MWGFLQLSLGALIRNGIGDLFYFSVPCVLCYFTCLCYFEDFANKTLLRPVCQRFWDAFSYDYSAATMINNLWRFNVYLIINMRCFKICDALFMCLLWCMIFFLKKFLCWENGVLQVTSGKPMVTTCLEYNRLVDYMCGNSCIPKRSCITKIVRTYTYTCTWVVSYLTEFIPSS